MNVSDNKWRNEMQKGIKTKFRKVKKKVIYF